MTTTLFRFNQKFPISNTNDNSGKLVKRGFLLGPNEYIQNAMGVG